MPFLRSASPRPSLSAVFDEVELQRGMSQQQGGEHRGGELSSTWVVGECYCVVNDILASMTYDPLQPVRILLYM